MKSQHFVAQFPGTRGGVLIAAFLVLSFQPVAFGQSEDEIGGIEEVVVTGSRIKRSTEFDLPAPVQALDNRDLEISGTNELSEALAELPAITAAITSETSQSSTQSSGQSTISLRNLGSSRTLTLIDGRRTVGNTSTGSTISLDTIPDSFIERIEVITGGTSAVYGSDAVTGVVNIITRNNFEGFTIDARYGSSDEGGNEEKSIEVAAGANFDDGRGNMMFAIKWDEEGPLFEHERRQAIDAREVDVNRNDEPDAFEPNLSSNYPGGVFGGNAGDALNPDYDSSWWFYDNEGTGALTEDFSTSQDGYNFLGPETLSIPRDRILVAGKMHYDLAESVQFFASAHYSQIYTKSERAADTANAGRLEMDFPVFLADGVTPHPFVPQEIFDDAVELGRDGVFFRRRWVEHGTRFREADQDTLRLWTGVQGDFADSWTYEVSMGYGEWRRSQSRVGDLVIPNYQAAVNVEYVDPADPGLGLQCADDFARGAGCVPLNVFGISMTPEMVDWVILRDQLRAMNRTTTASAWASGDIFDLPAGPIGLAAGYEYRKEQSQTRWDPISTSGGGTVTQQVNQDGEQDVNEFFVETIVPLLADTPGFQDLTLEAAVRFSDYSTIGSVTSWKGGLIWAPVDQFRLRATVSEANRAPNNIELFSRGLGSQGPMNDPCDGVTGTSTGTFDDTCRQDSVVAAIIASDGIFMNEGLQVQQPSVGNEDLVEETADTFTVGVVFTPSFAEGLSVAVDYYDIEITGAISEIDASDILEICYSSGDFAGTPSCGIPERNAVTGQLNRVEETSLNINSLTTSGYDITIRYSVDPADTGIPGFNRIPGSMDFGLISTNVRELEEEAPVPGTDETFTSDTLGLLGRPEWKTRFSISWSNGPWSVGWRTSYVGEMLNDDNLRSRKEACREFSNCSDKIALFLDGEYTHNIRFGYDWEGGFGAQRTRFYAGINNLTNNQGPRLWTLNDLADDGGDVGENSHSLYDQTGRFYYAGMLVEF